MSDAKLQGKGSLRGGENLVELPIETAVNVSDELPESAEVETVGNCRGPDLSFCTHNVPIYCPKSTHRLEQFWWKQSCISQVLSGQARGCCCLQKRDSFQKVLGNLWQWQVTKIHLISARLLCLSFCRSSFSDLCSPRCPL